jgi:hypothetical protein
MTVVAWPGCPRRVSDWSERVRREVARLPAVASSYVSVAFTNKLPSLSQPVNHDVNEKNYGGETSMMTIKIMITMMMINNHEDKDDDANKS